MQILHFGECLLLIDHKRDPNRNSASLVQGSKGNTQIASSCNLTEIVSITFLTCQCIDDNYLFCYLLGLQSNVEVSALLCKGRNFS